MAKKNNGPKEKKFKHLTPAEVAEIRQLSTQELLESYMFQTRVIRDVKRQKKDDSSIKKLKEEVKLHRDTTVSDKTRQELKELKDREKEIKTEIDEGIEDQLEEIKELNKDYREKMAPSNEKARLIQAILDARG